MLPIGGHREPYGPQHISPTRDENGVLHWPGELILDGPAVLSFSTQRVPPAVERLLEYSGVAKDSVDFLFSSGQQNDQRNHPQEVGAADRKVPSTLRDFGNTSGASCPSP